MSNTLCVTLPYKYNGNVKLNNDSFLVFSTDEDSSEIGIFYQNTCTYKKLVNDKCLNFKQSYPVSGMVRTDNEGDVEVIFVDGYNNDKIINLSKIAYKFSINNDTCNTKDFTNELDCESIKLIPNIKAPIISVEKTTNGNLPDGVYRVAISYVIEGIRFTDYMSTTQHYFIHQKEGSSGLFVSIENIDRRFEKYELLVIGTIDGVSTNKIIGTYNTSQNIVSVSSWNTPNEVTIPSTELTVTKINYDKTKIITANSEYLMRAGVSKKPIINYQPQASKILAKWVVKQVPLKYYENDGKDISYFRDENYLFYVRLRWEDGEYTDSNILINRAPTPYDLSPATGVDVFEIDDEKECKPFEKIANWEVENTASEMTPINSEFKCNERIIGEGTFGYAQSESKYPDNVEMFGENSCKNIRLFKFPNEEKVPRYSVIKGETYVNILGVQFYNIEAPKDEKGNIIKGITGIEFIRQQRDEGNKTVISRGIITNMGEYKQEDKNMLYSNFPFNSLESNSYLSSKQTYKKSDAEQDYIPLNQFSKQRFTYYTPFGNYFGRRKVRGYIQIETEESGSVNGFFEKTKLHPKFKLFTNFSLYFSLVTGLVEAYLVTNGKKTVIRDNGKKVTTTTSTTPPQTIVQTVTNDNEQIITSDTASKLATVSVTNTKISFAEKALRGTIKVLQTIVSVGEFAFQGAIYASQIFKAIKDFSPYIQYAYQYNAEVFYNNQKIKGVGNRRRRLKFNPFYLDGGIHTTEDSHNINNGGRNSAIYIHLEKDITNPSVKDNSRKTMSEFNIGVSNENKILKSTSSVHYVTNKQKVPNQYGAYELLFPVKISDTLLLSETTISSPILFGGDCIIAEQTHVNKFPIFKQSLSTENSIFPDGTPYDYRLYNNVGFARYWIDSSDYNFGQLFSLLGKSRPSMSRLPNQKYNLDVRPPGGINFLQEDQVFYTSVNGVFRYIAEVEYNISYREHKDENVYQRHYSSESTDLSEIFSTSNILKKENFSLDYSFQKFENVYLSSVPLEGLHKQTLEKNSISYSLPSFSTQKFNNWRYFLPNNYFTFDERDFGTLTGIHAIDKDRVMFLFSGSSPFISLGRDQLQTANGRNITIGDNGLFAQTPREIISTDVSYGSNHDKYSFSANQFGRFYISSQQGKLFNFSENLDEISRQGWQQHLSEYLPLFITKDFPNFVFKDNPQTGVGYLIAFDNTYETVYFIKRDYSIKEEFKKDVTFDSKTNKFYLNTLPIELTSEYFENTSFTLSYSPTQKSFISHHDWFPDDIIQTENHFISVKDKGLYKHNEDCKSYCNYYGKQYPYEVGVTVSTGNNTHILESIEWEQEGWEYTNECRDRWHNYNDCFDKLIISNTEQSSGYLNLVNGTNERYLHRMYPEFVSPSITKIPYIKTENHFRVNDFYDITINRGRLDTSKIHIWNNKKNGYEKVLTQSNLDNSQKRLPRFRHYYNEILFIKEVPTTSLITKFISSKINNSSR